MPTKGDSENSWTVKVSDISNYDLPVKNPAKQKPAERMEFGGFVCVDPEG